MSDFLKQPYLDEHEAAIIMRLSPSTLRKWRHLGRGPTYSKIHGRIVYSSSDVQDFIIDRRVNSTASFRS